MAELERSSVDEQALRDWLAANAELASALGDVANKVAASAKAHVMARSKSHGRGLPYRVKTRIADGRSETNPLTAVISAPLGAFLGTDTGFRHQTRAFGHVTSLWHVADDYALADAAESLWVGE